MDLVNTLVGVIGSAYIPKLNIKDIIEICVLIYTLYKIILSMINTRAMVVVKGIGYMAVVYVIAYMFNLSAILLIFKNIITVCMFASVLIFQPELRKMIERIGTGKVKYTDWFKRKIFGNKEVHKRFSDDTIESIVDACGKMSKVKTGALIVFEKDIPLTEYITSGIAVNADVSSGLLINIFEKNTPLHDGAVIMLGDKVVSATCYLPLSKNGNIDKNMGTRHRAGIGVTEVTDCFVITVSEETGAISFISGGKIEHNISEDRLRCCLKDMQSIGEMQEKTKIGEKIKKNMKSNIKYKVVAALIGIVGWVVLMNIANPVETMTLTDIPITVVNDNILVDKNKTYELSKHEVDLTVSSTRRELDRLKADEINVIADLSKITYANSVELEVYSDKINIKEYSIRGGKFVEVDIDELVEKEFSIENNIVLKSGIDNWAISGVNSNINSVKVLGGSKVIDRIGSVKAGYIINEPSNIVKCTAQIRVYDKNGDEISSGISLSADTVEYTVNMSGSKRIPVNITVNDTSNSEEYSVWQIKYSPESIDVIGNSASYGFESIDIPIDIDVNALMQSNGGNTSNFTNKEVSIKDYIPSDVIMISDVDIIKVSIQFKQTKKRTVWVPVGNIAMEGLENTKKATFNGIGINVEIVGEPTDVDSIGVSDLGAFVDLKGKEFGTYDMSVQFRGNKLKNDNDIRINKQDTISVKIEPKEIVNIPENTVIDEHGDNDKHNNTDANTSETPSNTGNANEGISGDKNMTEDSNSVTDKNNSDSGEINDETQENIDGNEKVDYEKSNITNDH